VIGPARAKADQVRALAAEGHTRAEIAQRLGVSERSVYRLLAGA
jgi:DNA-binding CsgD family transcriptional regulator